VARKDAYDEKAKRYRDRKTGQFRAEKGQAWDYHKVVVVEHFSKGQGHGRETIDYRTTVYTKTRHKDEEQIKRETREANHRFAKKDGFEPVKHWRKLQNLESNPVQVENMTGKHRKDWIHESKESRSKPNRPYPEHYNHKVSHDGKWVEIDD
jgi:hypothetical protein